MNKLFNTVTSSQLMNSNRNN